MIRRVTSFYYCAVTAALTWEIARDLRDHRAIIAELMAYTLPSLWVMIKDNA